MRGGTEFSTITPTAAARCCWKWTQFLRFLREIPGLTILLGQRGGFPWRPPRQVKTLEGTSSVRANAPIVEKEAIGLGIANAPRAFKIVGSVGNQVIGLLSAERRGAILLQKVLTRGAWAKEGTGTSPWSAHEGAIG